MCLWVLDGMVLGVSVVCAIICVSYEITLHSLYIQEDIDELKFRINLIYNITLALCYGLCAIISIVFLIVVIVTIRRTRAYFS